LSRARINRERIRQRANKFRFYRIGRLAELLDVDPSTIWRWYVREHILPPPIELSPGVRGWTEDQLEELFRQRREAADA
jgi:predicted DNA-binding transcriptional regulator AlpA